jgi:hypothetical protein
MRFITCLAFFILLSGCAATTTNYYTSTVQSWRGSNAKSLIQVWGRPDTQIVNPNGSAIYVYKTQSYSNSSVQGSDPVGVNVSRTGKPIIVTTPTINNAGTRGSPQSLNCLAVFETDPKGIIISTEIRGKACYASPSFVNKMSNPNTLKGKKRLQVNN